MVGSARELVQEFKRRADACSLRTEVLGDGDFHSEIAIVGEFPGERECTLKIPHAGGSGQHLWNTLRKYGITRTHVWNTHAVKRPPAYDAKKKPTIPRPELEHWEGLLDWELKQLPNLKYVLVLGDWALSALTGQHGITHWRGSVLERHGRTYVCAFNPSMVLKEAKWETIFAFDIAKLDRVMKGQYKPYEIKFHLNPSPLEAVRWIEKMRDDKLPVSFDIEVIGGETACVGLANHNHEGMCISYRDLNGNRFGASEELDIRRKLQGLVADPSTRLVAQNGSFDSAWLWYKDRIKCDRVWFDTLLAHHTLYPLLPHSLGFLTAQYTDHPYYKDEKSAWKEGGNIDRFWEYNVRDCCVTRKVHERLSIELKQQGMDKFFFDHVMAIQPHLVKMCVLGIDMDMGLKEYITVQLQQDVRDLVSKFHQTVAEATGEADYQPNPKSNKQMAELYFDKLRLVGRGTSTDAENRKRMLAHPRTLEPAKAVLRAVDEFAKEQKFLATYAEMRVDPDGRGRSEYKQYGTQNAPGRLSSTGTLWGSGANFQNQPERAKPMFLADKNCRFVYFDLSQAEARIVAEIWNVTALKANFALAAGQGVDVHRANAATIFKCSIDDIPKEDRFPDGTVTKRFLGKRCVHGLNYRMQIQKLADVCGIPYAQAEQAWWAYHRAFPEIQLGWEETISEVYRDKVLYTPLGRRMIFLGRLPSRNAAHGSEEASQLDSIIAFKPQATVGDHVAKCIANIECDPEWPILEARVVLNIHDALIAQTPDSDDIALHCAKVMKRHAEAPIMIRGNPLVIPADFAMSQAVAWRVTNEGRNDEKLEFYEANDNGRHRWSSLKKLKLAA